MITKYGYDVFFTVATLSMVLAIVSLLFVEPKVVRYSLVIFAAVVFAFCLNFFRDPKRTIPSGDNLVVSPADGKIILIKPVQETEFLNSEATQISIFMSPLNVHVNRNPVSGTVAFLKYNKGEYFAAFEDKASEKNEQNTIGIKGVRGKVLFRQIAGFVARRIVCTLKQGDHVRLGERFGMIKFGSRVDVFVPKTAIVKVKIGDTAVAGETVLAEFG
ncbi:MAG: phosphatidylserine decarboxylase family protein [Ignavibacteriales bacterium]|nr:phosphatidylserine decarboxylase family protein [Ignavibacteriales bacterium]